MADLRDQVGAFEYNVALQRIWLDVLDAANRYIEATAPFKLAKTDRDACKVVLVNLAEAIRVIAILIKPFLPRTAETFYRSFNFEDARAWDHVGYDDALRRSRRPRPPTSPPHSSAGKPHRSFPRSTSKRSLDYPARRSNTGTSSQSSRCSPLSFRGPSFCARIASEIDRSTEQGIIALRRDPNLTVESDKHAFMT